VARVHVCMVTKQRYPLAPLAAARSSRRIRGHGPIHPHPLPPDPQFAADPGARPLTHLHPDRSRSMPSRPTAFRRSSREQPPSRRVRASAMPTAMPSTSARLAPAARHR